MGGGGGAFQLRIPVIEPRLFTGKKDETNIKPSSVSESILLQIHHEMLKLYNT